jgi:hypothetical protein
MVLQQLSVYWSVDSADPSQPASAGASSGGLSSPALEPVMDGASDQQQQQQQPSEPNQQEDLILRPMDCVLLLKLQSAGADTRTVVFRSPVCMLCAVCQMLIACTAR